MRAAFATGDLSDFHKALRDRMNRLAEEFGEPEFTMPIVLCLAIPEKLGGDATAKELIRRFAVLNVLSRSVIDFYFLGWSIPRRDGEGIAFVLKSFDSCLNGLRAVGIKDFGQNADLIIVDASRQESGTISLNFSEAIRIDLALAAKEKQFTTLGSFLDSLVTAAEAVRGGDGTPSGDRATFKISDKLGLTIGKASFLRFILKTWGKIIGAHSIEAITTRNLGPYVQLDELAPRKPLKRNTVPDEPPTKSELSSAETLL